MLRVDVVAIVFTGLVSVLALNTVEVPEKVEVCRYGNETHQAGERFRPDPCTSCHCPRHGGRALCTIQDCMWEPHCLRRDKRPDECCGSCLEQGCLHSDGQVYPRGATILDSTCERCVCPEEGGPSICRQKFTCPDVHCVDMVTEPDSCCPSCPNGENCWLGKRVIKVGDVVNVGRCKQCRCPDVDSLPHWRKATGSHAICTTRPC